MEEKRSKKSLFDRQKFIVIALGVVVLLLLVAYIIVLNIKNEVTVECPYYDKHGHYLEYISIKSKSGSPVERIEAEDKKSFTLISDSEISYHARPLIYPEIPVDSIESIKVTNAGGSFTLYKDKAADAMLISGLEMQIYNLQSLSDLRLQARYMIAIELIEEPGDLSQYGLSDDFTYATVTVKDSSGSENTVYIGDELPTGNAYYAKHKDKDFVYVLDGSVDIFFDGIYSHISPVIVGKIPENNYQYIERFSIIKNKELFLDSEIVPEDIRTTSSDTDLHKITYPGNYPASMNNYYAALSNVAGITGSYVVDANIKVLSEEEQKIKNEFYGFDNPTNEVFYKFGGQDYGFITGKRFVDEAGNVYYYVYSEYMDTVVVLPLENAPFLEYSLMDFIDENVFQININNIEKVNVASKDGNITYLLSGEGQNLVVTEQGSGKTIDTSSFRQFYMSLLNIKIEGYGTKADVTGQSEFEFTVTTKFNEVTTYKFDVISTTRSLITLSGSSEFYTNRGYVTKACNNFKKLINGETISADY